MIMDVHGIDLVCIFHEVSASVDKHNILLELCNEKHCKVVIVNRLKSVRSLLRRKPNERDASDEIESVPVPIHDSVDNGA